MTTRELLNAIGELDEVFYAECDAYVPPKRGKNIAKRVAIVAVALLGLFYLSYLAIPTVRAFFQQKDVEEIPHYIQLPPELTTWSEPTAGGGGCTQAGIVRGDTMYLLTQEEYHKIMDEGADPDEVLAERENWAAEWKDYTPPEQDAPPQDGVVVME